jgi:hypothetical protein
VNLLEELLSEGSTPSDPVLRVALYSRMAFGLLWSLVLIFRPESWIASLNGSEALNSESFRNVLAGFAFGLLGSILLFWSAFRSATRREQTYLAVIALFYIFHMDLAHIEYTTLPLDRFTSAMGNISFLFILYGIACNEKVALWQDGNLHNPRNALFICMAGGLLIWFVRNPVYGTLATHFSAELSEKSVLLLRLFHRAMFSTVILNSVVWLFGSDKAVKGTLLTTAIYHFICSVDGFLSGNTLQWTETAVLQMRVQNIFFLTVALNALYRVRLFLFYFFSSSIFLF